MNRILVVEDEANQRTALAGFLRKRGFAADGAVSGEEALVMLKQTRYDLVLTDQNMEGMDGLTLLGEVKGINPEIEVIVLTAYAEVPSAVQATKQGAYDYLTKPVDLESLELTIRRALERRQLVVENRQLRQTLGERHGFDHIVSVSGAMESVLNMAARVAEVDTPVLITGESGTGKELVARAIHLASPRRDKAFVAVNCAALNRNLIESELFGHERGAFTGAIRQRPGKLETADGGVLFLDELGEIPPEIQVKLLRFLQDGTFERVGSDVTLKADVRLIAATNRQLEDAIREGEFREDFYYRINVVNIHIPPLRSRREDVRPLIDRFLQASRERLGVKSFSREALDRLLTYDYPGNIRELQNMVERAMVMSRGEVISIEDLPPTLVSKVPQSGPKPLAAGSLPESVKFLEREMILSALEEHHYVQVRAAQKLGITEKNLRDKMKKLGISRKTKGSA